VPRLARGLGRARRRLVGVRVGGLAGAISCVALLIAPASSAGAEAFGKISGQVSEASSHSPLTGIEVCAISMNYQLLNPEEVEHHLACAQTGTGGEYTLAELLPESYYVVFFDRPKSTLDFLPQIYEGKAAVSEATSVPVLAEATTPSIDAELLPGAEIAGTITNAATGAPVHQAEACAVRTNAKGSLEGECAESEANGQYTIRGLPSGAYKVGFFAQEFEPGFYNGKSSEAEAELLTVTAPQLTSGIDDALKPGGGPTPPAGSTPQEPSTATKLPGGIGSSPSSSSTATLALAAKRIAVARDGRVLVKLDCAGTESCRAKLTLQMQSTVVVKGKRTHRTVVLGTSAVLSLDAHEHASATFELNAAGRRLLRADHGRLSVQLALVTVGHRQDDSVVLVEQGAAAKR
jgi:hypothetical protein